MEALFRVAAEHQCSRVEWTNDNDNDNDNDNEGAMNFYASLGTPLQTSKVFYRVQDIGTGFAGQN